MGVRRNGHCHDTESTEEATDTFTVKVTGNIFSVGSNIGMEGLYEANDRFGVRVRDIFQLDISSILGEVTCGVGDSSKLPDPLVGNFSFANFLNDYIIIFFDYEGAEHWFSSPAGAVPGSDELPEPWPPTVDDGTVTIQTTGEWTMHTKGKNHKRGCTGEGGPGSITWTAEVKNITGTRSP